MALRHDTKFLPDGDMGGFRSKRFVHRCQPVARSFGWDIQLEGQGVDGHDIGSKELVLEQANKRDLR